jgi:hypothetical protein
MRITCLIRWILGLVFREIFLFNRLIVNIVFEPTNPSCPSPFVGVCGVRSSAEYHKLVALAERILPGTDRFIMAGIKDITGDLHTAKHVANVRPFIHCNYTSQESFETTITRRFEQTKSFARGLQLNVVPWMETDFAPLWRSIKKHYPGIALMLQAHQDIMERYTPEQIARRLYGLPIDYILFDASQSRGIPHDPADMQRYVSAIHQHQLPVGVVVSGGLGAPGTMQQIFQPLARHYPAISCDAFLRLYDSTARHLCWPAVERYLAAWRKTVLPYTVHTRQFHSTYTERHNGKSLAHHFMAANSA